MEKNSKFYNKDKKILVLGSANLDVFMKVQKAPEKGETISASTLEKAIGGKGCNTAIALGKLGFNVEFFGQLGNDSAKDEILKKKGSLTSIRASSIGGPNKNF